MNSPPIAIGARALDLAQSWAAENLLTLSKYTIFEHCTFDQKDDAPADRPGINPELST